MLAYAGLERMGWQDRISQVLDSEYDILHAVGQGALAIECRQEDKKTLELLQGLNHNETMFRCVAERAFMRTLEGGCSVPLGVYSSLASGDSTEDSLGEWKLLRLKGNVCSLDGQIEVQGEQSVPLLSLDSLEINEGRAMKLGEDLAQELISKGAQDILKSIVRSI